MTLPPLNLTPEEATAIAVALAASGPMPFGEAGRTAVHKIVTAMSATGRDGARELIGRIRLLQDDGELERTPVLGIVERAVAEGRVIGIDYVDRAGCHDSGPSGRAVWPRGLWRSLVSRGMVPIARGPAHVSARSHRRGAPHR